MKKFKKYLFTILFWLLSLTWGVLTTTAGFIVTLFCIIFLKGRIHRNGCSYIVEVGENWGGLDLGAVALCARYSDYFPYHFQHTRKHEFGHAIQNIIFGPFHLFICIASAVRYWVFRIRSSKGKRNPEYDSIWFEGTATKWGELIVNWLESK